MPEQSISRSKYNYNKHQKEKQNKILQYYRRSFKSQLAPTQQITRPRRTRKQHFQSIANGTGRIPKLTKVQNLVKEPIQDTSSDKQLEQLQQKNIEKSELINIPSTKSIQKGGNENQMVIMD